MCVCLYVCVHTSVHVHRSASHPACVKFPAQCNKSSSMCQISSTVQTDCAVLDIKIFSDLLQVLMCPLSLISVSEQYCSGSSL